MNKKLPITVHCNHLAREGVAIFQIRQGRHCLEQEVTITGDLKADVAKAARWGVSTYLGQKVTGRLVRRPGCTYTTLPNEALTAYGITRETAPIGQVSIDCPVWQVVLEA